MPTATGLRISSVNGTAFLDNCPADILAAVGAQVKIYDSKNRFLLGYVGEVGSSETTSEKVTNGNNEAAVMSGVTAVRGAIAQSNEQASGGTYSAKFTADTAGVQYVKYTTTAGGLYKCGGDMFTPSGQGYTQPAICHAANNIGLFSSGDDTWKTLSGLYRTAITGDWIGIGQNVGGNVGEYFYIDNFSVAQVTAPSSSGVTILDAVGGNQNFISKDASFTYNAASYTYEIISAGNAFNYFQNMMR